MPSRPIFLRNHAITPSFFAITPPRPIFLAITLSRPTFFVVIQSHLFSSVIHAMPWGASDHILTSFHKPPSTRKISRTYTDRLTATGKQTSTRRCGNFKWVYFWLKKACTQTRSCSRAQRYSSHIKTWYSRLKRLFSIETGIVVWNENCRYLTKIVGHENWVGYEWVPGLLGS